MEKARYAPLIETHMTTDFYGLVQVGTNSEVVKYEFNIIKSFKFRDIDKYNIIQNEYCTNMSKV